MRDAFEVQDEIARKIAEALRLTLAPQSQVTVTRGDASSSPASATTT
jgi:hypothetical protein